MIYNELLNKISSMMMSASQNTNNSRNVSQKTHTEDKVSTLKEDTTSTMLNKIGLEVQRQGGY